MFKNKNYFDPNKSFFELKVVKVTGGVIVTISTMISLAIFFSTDYNVCLTANCFNNFITDFRFPIGILALTIPIGALFAAEHRSKLTIAQIKSAESQNNFANYYKHIEEFDKYIKNEKLDKYVTNINKTHAAIFGESMETNFEIQTDVLNDAIRMVKNAYFFLRRLEVDIKTIDEPECSDKNLQKTIYRELKLVGDLIEGIYENLEIDGKFISTYKFNEYENQNSGQSNNIRQQKFSLYRLVTPIRESVSILSYFLSFATSYSQPPVFICINNLKFEEAKVGYEFYLPRLEDLESASRCKVTVIDDGINEKIVEIDKNVFNRFGQ